MCGLAGLLSSRGADRARIGDIAARMAAAIEHRGPDDSGGWSEPDAGIAFGFRRLAIFDLTQTGHQPMHSASGRYVVVFNGEVFNHVELRRTLEGLGARFRGGSDTEVLLAAFDEWGIPGAAQRFVGMFAIALWDREHRALHLIRDRVGIKPLFVAHHGGRVLFASELKALLAVADFPRAVDVDAMDEYLRLLYVPGPRSIFRHVTKLLPGTILTIRDPARELPAPVPFWSLHAIAAGSSPGDRPSDGERLEELRGLVDDAVRLRMRADVPFGAWLSGGVDSSVVVAHMRHHADTAVRTFSISFDSDQHSEARYARAVADHLGTEHTEYTLTGADALTLVPDIADIFDEPIADAGQMPTVLVSRLTKARVTVALSGDGGDELFAGYNRYRWGARMIPPLLQVPMPLRTGAAALLRLMHPDLLNNLALRSRGMLPRLLGDKLVRMRSLLLAEDADAAYRRLSSTSAAPWSLVRSSTGPCFERDDRLVTPPHLSLLRGMMLKDQGQYLPDDLLAKVDRASMSVALEVRVPLLDHRLVELSWQLPDHMLIRDGTSKWILKELLRTHLPDALIDREKVGFSVPLADWLRGPLRTWAGDLLSPAAIEPLGLLDAKAVATRWSAFLQANSGEADELWAVIVPVAWHRRWNAAV